MKQGFEMKMYSGPSAIFLLTSTGCESIALLPRPAIDDRADISRRDLDRGGTRAPTREPCGTAAAGRYG